MISQIKELIKNKDNAEKIRDQIACILKAELLNQKQLADESEEITDKKDFDIAVYIENSRPWELTGDKKDSSPFPLVNVCLQETVEDEKSPGATVGNVKYNGTFYIDCYGCGNNQPENTDEYVPDDFLSTMRAWHTARVIRNILMSGFYAYLGMQGLVRKRKIKKITTIIPPLTESSISITGCRIIFEVEFHEVSIVGDGVKLEEISFTSNKNGEVSLIDALFDYKEKKETEE